MAATKIRDLAVKVSEYTDQQGQTKGRYENVGSMMKGEDGGIFIIFKRTFNPAGVPNPDNRDSLMISCFELRDGDQPQRPPAQPQQPPQSNPSAYQNTPNSQAYGQQQAPQQNPADDFDDGSGIPF